MKTNWQTKKLGEVCGLIKGKKPKSFSDEGKKYLTAKVIRDIEEPKYTKDKNAVYIQKDDVFIIMDGSNSGELFRRFDGALASTMGLLKIDRNNFDINFLLYFLKGYRKEFTKSRTGSAIPHLNKDQFNNLLIPVIPLPKQHRIVKILDGVFGDVKKVKEKAEKNLANAKELFESYLQSVFENPGKDWEEKKLGEVVKLEYGKPLPKLKRKTNGKYPVYGANGIKSRSDTFYFDKPSIIVGRKGSAGELNLTENKFWPLDVTYFVVFNDKKYDLKFIYFLLITLKLPKLAKGVKPGINRNDIYQINIDIPKSLATQKQIVKKLDELSNQTKKMEKIYQRKIDDLEELKKSVLKKAFSGDL